MPHPFAFFLAKGAGGYEPPTPVSRSPARNREKEQRLDG
jgi:hypothetical protein